MTSSSPIQRMVATPVIMDAVNVFGYLALCLVVMTTLCPVCRIPDVAAGVASGTGTSLATTSTPVAVSAAASNSNNVTLISGSSTDLGLSSNSSYSGLYSNNSLGLPLNNTSNGTSYNSSVTAGNWTATNTTVKPAGGTPVPGTTGATTTPLPQLVGTKSVQAKLVMGMVMGFTFAFGLFVSVCVVWRVCCGLSGQPGINNNKIAPVDFRSDEAEDATRAGGRPRTPSIESTDLDQFSVADRHRPSAYRQ